MSDIKSTGIIDATPAVKDKSLMAQLNDLRNGAYELKLTTMQVRLICHSARQALVESMGREEVAALEMRVFDLELQAIALAMAAAGIVEVAAFKNVPAEVSSATLIH